MNYLTIELLVNGTVTILDLNTENAASKEDMLTHLNEDNEGDEITDFEVESWGEVPANFQNFDSDLSELVEAYENSHLDIDVFEAAKECDISMSDVEEAYSGQHTSDEDFAEDMADQLGYLDKGVNWPYSCIDWERAASELMMDYSEANGYYFRNL